MAAAYGRYDIPGWCSDRGALVTWNLARESINQNRPDITIDVDNCLMSCAFHPEHPVSSCCWHCFREKEACSSELQHGRLSV